MLASHPLVITIDGFRPFTLMPSLETAIRIECKFGHVGLKPIVQSLQEGSVTAIKRILEEGGDIAPFEFMRADALAVTITRVATALIEFIGELAKLEDDLENEPEPSGKSGETLEFKDLYAKLFGIGTGVLGWTPDETYQATPFEIMAAYKARTAFIGEILKSIFGSSSEGATNATLEDIRNLGGVF